MRTSLNVPPRLLGPACIALALVLATTAQADNPVDGRNRELAAEVARDGKQPHALLPLLELWGNWDRATPAQTTARLEELEKDARLAPPLRVRVRALLAQARMRTGEPARLGEDFRSLGYVESWRLIGPFDNEGKLGLDAETPPEQKRMEAPDLQASYPGRERPVSWRELPAIVNSGYVSFGALLRPTENVCGLAETFVHSERAQPLSLWIGAGGALKTYWNGEEVLRDATYRRPHPDRHVVMVSAHAGYNRVLLKVCVTDTAWGFQLRVGDARGEPAKGVRIETNTAEALNIKPGHAKKPPAAPATPLVALERAATAKKPRAEDLARLARYLHLSDSDDPAERRAPELAARAAELAPTLAHLELAVGLAEQRAEQMRFTQRALGVAGNDPKAKLMQALVELGGPQPERALPLLAAVPRDHVSWPEATRRRALLLSDLELPELGRSVLLEALAATGPTPQLLGTLAELDATTGRSNAAIEGRRKLLQLRFDDLGSRKVLITDAMQRGATSEVLEHVGAIEALWSGSPEVLLYLAHIYDGLGRDDMLLAMHRRAMELAPESTDLLRSYGQALLRAEQKEPAAEAFSRALALKPQDATIRELLEQLRHEPRPDESMARSSEEILKRRVESSGYPTTTLHELTVKRVFANGLGSTFQQLAVQVHDDEGARQFRSYSIQYDPDTQQIDLRLARVFRKSGAVLESVRTYEQQLGEPWYRIYYDTRAVVVVFPTLEPGDVVEIRYRIDDIAHRNLFADYFGDLHPLQGFSPKRRTEYVLITPKQRRFYVNQPGLAGLQHVERTEGAQHIDHWFADEVPAIVPEAGMPGITEISPYLHISTYANWQDVGRWYWGLIRDQLYADASLKRTVQELVAGATNTRQKVERIQSWVVANTRYVGLEFGIHGYLPYRVPLIVQRGFGDCKDKASLLYTMLREAGVDARIVLVRTRRNGGIDSLPASLAVFDHAIAYVPELDMYLDGTAEHSGASELPVEDQGVRVLVVGPEGAQERTTPVLDAALSRRERTLNVELNSDGSARVEARETVAGAEAASYRGYYEAVGTRAERFERALGALYPGVKLLRQSFDKLDDLQHPVVYDYEVNVPQLAQRDGESLKLAPSVLDDLLRNLARSQTRKHVLDLQGRRSYVEDRSVKLPKGLTALELPESGESRSSFGRLSLRYSAQDGKVGIHTEFSLDQDRITPEQYPEFRRWVESADQLLRQRIAIRKDGAAGSANGEPQ